MEINKVLVTSKSLFIYRHQGLFKALSSYFDSLECIETCDVHSSKIIRKIMELLYCINHQIPFSQGEDFYKTSQAFIRASKETEKKIKQLKYTPDLIFHVFSTCCPFWEGSDIPYVMYLDYTMAVAVKNYQPWNPFKTHQELLNWLECEKKAYKQAKHIFTMSALIKSSLIEDYEIQPEKITAVGASGNFDEPYKGEKTFGSQKILFNGSDFERKGGDLVLAAFQKVRQTIPDVKLVVIGRKINTSINGVENPGTISSTSELKNLFLQSDLVIAPAYCEPFGVFLVEAMNYGVPCIVSANNANGITEFLHDGIDSIITYQPTADILANHIINLFKNTDLLSSMSQAARENVRTTLNWNNIAKNISEVLCTES